MGRVNEIVRDGVVIEKEPCESCGILTTARAKFKSDNPLDCPFPMCRRCKALDPNLSRKLVTWLIRHSREEFQGEARSITCPHL